MNHGKIKWVLLALAASLGLALVLHGPLPRPKARAQPIQAVNHVARVSIPLPATNAPPALPPKK